jgi:TRAP-type C4-dicarboxylate transport system permease small subunit
MIGVMIGVRDSTHFDLDLLPRTVSPKVEGAFRLFVHFAMLLASAIFLIYGWSFARFGALQYSEIAGLPMLTIYIAWPLAGATMALFLLEKFIEDVRIFKGEIPAPRHEIPKGE